MPSPRTIFAAPARSATPSSPTKACSRSSSSCSSTANSTRSGWPTRPSSGSRRSPRPKRLPDLNSQTRQENRQEPEGAMEAAIDRIMHTYDLLANRTSAASAEARSKVSTYIQTLFEAAEGGLHRLTVCGLPYLRELDGRSDPVKAGYTGL